MHTQRKHSQFRNSSYPPHEVRNLCGVVITMATHGYAEVEVNNPYIITAFEALRQAGAILTPKNYTAGYASWRVNLLNPDQLVDALQRVIPDLHLEHIYYTDTPTIGLKDLVERFRQWERLASHGTTTQYSQHGGHNWVEDVGVGRGYNTENPDIAALKDERIDAIIQRHLLRVGHPGALSLIAQDLEQRVNNFLGAPPEPGAPHPPLPFSPEGQRHRAMAYAEHYFEAVEMLKGIPLTLLDLMLKYNVDLTTVQTDSLGKAGKHYDIIGRYNSKNLSARVAHHGPHPARTALHELFHALFDLISAKRGAPILAESRAMLKHFQSVEKAAPGILKAFEDAMAHRFGTMPIKGTMIEPYHGELEALAAQALGNDPLLLHIFNHCREHYFEQAGFPKVEWPLPGGSKAYVSELAHTAKLYSRSRGPEEFAVRALTQLTLDMAGRYLCSWDRFVENAAHAAAEEGITLAEAAASRMESYVTHAIGSHSPLLASMPATVTMLARGIFFPQLSATSLGRSR